MRIMKGKIYIVLGLLGLGTFGYFAFWASGLFFGCGGLLSVCNYVYGSAVVIGYIAITIIYTFIGIKFFKISGLWFLVFLIMPFISFYIVFFALSPLYDFQNKSIEASSKQKSVDYFESISEIYESIIVGIPSATNIPTVGKTADEHTYINVLVPVTFNKAYSHHEFISYSLDTLISAPTKFNLVYDNQGNEICQLTRSAHNFYCIHQNKPLTNILCYKPIELKATPVEGTYYIQYSYSMTEYTGNLQKCINNLQTYKPTNNDFKKRSLDEIKKCMYYWEGTSC
jgi:hypothetical protein